MDIQLIYASLATQAFSDEELEKLLATCAANNASGHITGMLLYGNGKFMQVLEGEADLVDALVRKIKADSRHTKINVLVRTPVQQRDFHAWSMGFRRVDRDCAGNLAHFSAFFDEDFERDRVSDHPNLALSVLKSFAFPRHEGRDA